MPYSCDASGRLRDLVAAQAVRDKAGERLGVRVVRRVPGAVDHRRLAADRVGHGDRDPRQPDGSGVAPGDRDRAREARDGVNFEVGPARVLAQVGEEMSDDVRWIRTYVVQEESGKLGTLCIYEGTSAEKVREQAERTGMPADEVALGADTGIVRPDPQPANA